MNMQGMKTELTSPVSSLSWRNCIVFTVFLGRVTLDSSSRLATVDCRCLGSLTGRDDSKISN